jgi:uncharacterized protein YlxW (UPF0749 family)
MAESTRATRITRTPQTTQTTQTTTPPAGSTPPLPHHVTEPLLALITQRSLDADYEYVARRRAAAQSPPDRTAPRHTAAIVLVVFGLLVTVAAVQTSRNASVDQSSRASLIDQVNLRREGVARLQNELAKEQQRLLALRDRFTAVETAQQAVRSRLQRLGVRTGFAAVRGPGVQVTVASAPGSDPNQLVRDSDLALLTDALWAAGAEAISVNDQRLTVLSAFRNVGVGILVNSQPVSPPYAFSVIGDPADLPANLLSSSVGEAWYALKDSFGFRFNVKNGGTMTLPAASPVTLRSAKLTTQKHIRPRTQGDNAS